MLGHEKTAGKIPAVFPNARSTGSGQFSIAVRWEIGAGEETRTLDVHLGKVVLYQLSYARSAEGKCYATPRQRQLHFRWGCLA
jgi:hypothetical protein